MVARSARVLGKSDHGERTVEGPWSPDKVSGSSSPKELDRDECGELGSGADSDVVQGHKMWQLLAGV
jgi:hypothetical protein